MGIVVAVNTANVSCGGRRWHVQRGSAWAADDPVVKAHPDLFTAEAGANVHRSVPVEQATRAPGERRATRRG